MRILISRAAAILLTVAAMAFAARAEEPLPSYTFGGLPWGADESTIREKLASKYTFQSKDKDGDLSFHGTIDNEVVSIIAYMSKGALVRVVVVIAPDDNTMLSTYTRFKRVLTEKYGAPAGDDHYFNKPYDWGDGYEEQAVRNNKGSLSTRWRPAADGSSLTMLVQKSTSVRVFYDTPSGAAEEKSRSSRSTSDF